MIAKCMNCGSADIKQVNAEVAFALGKAPPVYTLDKPIICLNCGYVVEGFVPAGPLAKLREHFRGR